MARIRLDETNANVLLAIMMFCKELAEHIGKEVLKSVVIFQFKNSSYVHLYARNVATVTLQSIFEPNSISHTLSKPKRF